MAANQVTVATPGPAGPAGIIYEGAWVITTVYQVRDVIRYTDNNLYICNEQHTASSLNTPVLNTTIWTIFINADDAFQWATKAHYTLIGDSVGNTGYSSLHHSLQSKNWATLTTDAVRNDTNTGDVDYSAKAWAVGGTEVTTTASRGAAKEWATTTGGQVDTSEYSSKEYAQGSVLAAGGSSKNWAQLATTPSTTATDASSKEWAVGVSTHKNEGSAKEWAIYTAGDVRGASAGSMSAKEWAVGTQGRGVAGEGSSKDWATRTGAVVDNADYSSKEYAIGTTASTGGSAKDYATYTGGGVRGATSDHSAKAWAVGGTGVTDTASKGAAKEWAVGTGRIDDQSSGDYSSKEWATGTTATSSKSYAIKVDGAVTGSEYSSKAWSLGGTGVTDTASAGSAKQWAIGGGASYTVGNKVDGSSGEYSAKYYAQQAEAAYDNLDDSFLGSKSSAPTVDNDGDALTAGDIYLNTSDGKLYFYSGSAWESFSTSGNTITSTSNTDLTLTTPDNNRDINLNPHGSGKVELNAATEVVGAVTVGVNDTGHDVKFFGATSGAYMLWDEDVDDLILAGAARAVIPDGQLVLGSTAITSTAAEINLIDGGTSRGTDAVSSGDGILINDGGTMKMTNVDTVSTYFSSHSVGGGNIVTTGALNSGSITSGFGTIDTGSSTITTTGAISGGSLVGTLSTAAQANITSVGTLTSLTGGTGDLNWDSGTLFVDSSENNVGIGTTTPGLNAGGVADIDPFTNFAGNVLHIDNTGGDATVIIGGSDQPNLVLVDANSSAGKRYYHQTIISDVYKFRLLNDAGSVVSDNLLTIDGHNANVGVVTTTPTSKFHVETAAVSTPLVKIKSTSTSVTQQALHVESALTSGASNRIADFVGTATVSGVHIDSGNTAGYTILSCRRSDGTERFRVRDDGNIYMPEVGNGTLTISSGLVGSTSDGRLKNKTRPLENGLDKVNKLSPTYYKWTEESGYDRKRDPKSTEIGYDGEYQDNEFLGFIAQDVKEVLPEIYKKSEDEPEKMLGIDDRALIALLFKSTQELSEKVTALENA